MHRLFDGFDLQHGTDVDSFGSKRQTDHLTWWQIRETLAEHPLQPVALRCVERVVLALEDANGSWFSCMYTYFMLFLITANLVLITLKSLPGVCNRSSDGRCGGDTMEAAMLGAFTVDYVVQFMCVPFSRSGVFDRKWLIDTVVPMSTDKLHSALECPRSERWWRWFSSPQALLDLASILPFWLTFILGSAKLPLSFLRILRLSRVLRFFKFGRFNADFHVLGETFVRSGNSIQVLLLYIIITSVIAGAALEIVEVDSGSGPFETVPSSAWWVYVHMVYSHNSAPVSREPPNTLAAKVICSILKLFMGILWNLPFAEIRKNYREVSREVEEGARLLQECTKESAQHPANDWMNSYMSPSVQIELLNGQQVVASGALPVPLLENHACNGRVSAVLPSGVLVRKSGKTPIVEFVVTWSPDEERKGPCGNLQLELLRGHHFPKWEPAGWKIKLSVPSHLYGEGRYHVWESSISNGRCTNPWWRDPVVSCNICWEDESSTHDNATRNGSDCTKSPPHSFSEDNLLHNQVLELFSKQQQQQLSEQSRKIEH